MSDQPKVVAPSRALVTRRLRPTNFGCCGAPRPLRKSPWFRRAKLVLKRIAGREPWFRRDIDVSLQRYGDWALRSDWLRQGDIVYVGGVGGNLSLETDLIRRHRVEVHAFDPSPESVRWVATQQLPPGLHFHALAIAGRDGILTLRARQAESSGTPMMYSAVDKARSGPEVQISCQSLHTIAQRLRHRSLALVKLDIEGAEYDALRSMLASSLLPRQVLVEFHHRFAGIGTAETVSAVRDLRTAGYRLAFISDTGRELTFLLDR